MAIPPPIDPRQLAAEIEASVAEFNRLAALAASMGVEVVAEVGSHQGVGEAVRPVLRVQVIAPL
jgi:hypothetical protein